MYVGLAKARGMGVFNRSNAYPILSLASSLCLFWLPHVLCKISITAIYCDTDYTNQLIKRDQFEDIRRNYKESPKPISDSFRVNYITMSEGVLYSRISE